MHELERSTASPRGLLLLIGVLYASQGIPMGLAFVAYPAIMRAAGYSTEAIGLIGLVALPWAIKFLWAPFVDRAKGGALGPRRSWIIPAQALTAALYFAIAALPDGWRADALVVISILLAINVVSATQDIATDGLAVEQLQGAEIAWANGLQIGAFTVGMTIGGSLTVVLYDSGGWILPFATLGAVTLATLIVALFVREPKRELVADRRTATRASVRRTLNRPGALIMISVAGLFNFAHAMVGAMSGPFLVDAGLSLSEIGLLSGIALTAVAAAGALLGSIAASRVGAPVTAVVAGAIAAGAIALWIGPAIEMKSTFALAMTITAGIGVLAFAAYTAFFTIFMQWASRDQAGTDFTVLQCAETCFGMIAAALAGQIAGAWGFSGFFTAAAVIGLLVMAWIAFALRRLGMLDAGRPASALLTLTEGDTGCPPAHRLRS